MSIPSTYRVRPSGRALRLTAALSATALWMALTPVASADIVSDPVTWQSPDSDVTLTPLGQYQTDQFDQSASEILDYHPASKRIVVVNAKAGAVDILDASSPATPVKLHSVAAPGTAISGGGTIAAGAGINSVSVRADGLAVAAVENPASSQNGWLMFFDVAGDGQALGAVEVGVLPDAVKISADGSVAVVANEGQPADDYSTDPEGSISVIDMPTGLAVAEQSDVRTADFHDWENRIPAGVRISGGRADAGTGNPQYPVSEVLEPEYSTISDDGSTAWVTLQENNALAIVDLATATVTEIVPLGTIDHRDVPIDASNKDDAIRIANWPVKGMFQPDTIDHFESNGQTFLVTANEGDARDYDGYSEEIRAKDLGDEAPPLCADADISGARDIDGSALSADDLLEKKHLGRLKITAADGLRADGSCYEELFSFGTRSMSVWSASGTLLWDSGDAFERLVAQANPDHFNASNDKNKADARSDDKGPEPEAIAVGTLGNRTFAFVGLERVGGIVVVDITDPTEGRVLSYINNRDFSANPENDLAASGDLGPESIKFVSAPDSPTGEAILIVGNEVSGTTTLYSINAPESPNFGSLAGPALSFGSIGALGKMGAFASLDPGAGSKN